MDLSGTYRHELKYRIGYSDYAALQKRLSAFMPRDVHAGAGGSYSVSSVYFDNYRDKALREKLDGVQKREKFRIRWYNGDFSFIMLEKKLKHSSLCLKIDAPVTLREMRGILSAPGPWMLEHPSELVRELYCKMKTQQLRPKVLVSYTREPYVYSPGNVRVTFDSDIRTSLFAQSFAVAQTAAPAVAASPGECVMEVKFDAFLPDPVAALLQTGTFRQDAFSKYGVCRRFG